MQRVCRTSRRQDTAGWVYGQDGPSAADDESEQGAEDAQTDAPRLGEFAGEDAVADGVSATDVVAFCYDNADSAAE